MPHLANRHSACQLYIACQISQRLPGVYRLPTATQLANCHTVSQLPHLAKCHALPTATPCQLPQRLPAVYRLPDITAFGSCISLARYHSACQVYTACQRYTACQLEHSLLSAYSLPTATQLANWHTASQLPHRHSA